MRERPNTRVDASLAEMTVHMIGSMPVKLKLQGDHRTRCGLICSAVGYETDTMKYRMLSEGGGEFAATTRTRRVTCRKCLNLISAGTIQAKKRRR